MPDGGSGLGLLVDSARKIPGLARFGKSGIVRGYDITICMCSNIVVRSDILIHVE
jgi:hypothetical protein